MVTLLIPAYNEQRGIGATVCEAAVLLSALFPHSELIVVDDGSEDATRACALRAAREISAQRPGISVAEAAHSSGETREAPARAGTSSPAESGAAGRCAIRVIGYAKNRGKGAAIAFGVAHAAGSEIVVTDADLAYGLQILPEALCALRESGADFLLGSRHLTRAQQRAYPPLRRVGSRVFAALVHGILRVRVTDTQCGFKCMRARAAKRVCALCETRGFAFDVEMIARAQKLAYRMCEFPVTVLRHRDTSVRLIRDGVKMTGQLFRIRRLLRREAGANSGAAG